MKEMRKLLLAIAAMMVVAASAWAQDELLPEEYGVEQSDTVEVFSPKMGKMIKNVVVLPSQYFDDESSGVLYPVIYLLHGHGGYYGSWCIIKPDLDYIASQVGAIIVCPDGEDSWYWDSPIDASSQFETYVSKELVGYIDDNYRTIADPRMRAIAGLSMGGHGSLWLGLRHPDVFGICGSMSGGLNILPFPNNWNMKDALGEYEGNKEVWKSHTVLTLIEEGTYKPGTKIMIDCGVDDFFIGVNRAVHEAMVEKGIAHDYIERPGRHNVDYWNNAIDYQLLFMQKAFDEIENVAE